MMAKSYGEMSVEELEEVRAEALKKRQEANEAFVAAGKALDAKRRRQKLTDTRDALAEQQAQVAEELARLE